MACSKRGLGINCWGVNLPSCTFANIETFVRVIFTRDIGVNHLGLGDYFYYWGRVPQNLQRGMQTVSQIFLKKYRSEFTKTRHFRRKNHFFSGERPMAPYPSHPPVDPTIAPNQSFCPPRMAAVSTPMKIRHLGDVLHSQSRGLAAWY